MQHPVRIENPLPSGHTHTSPNRARRYVRAGRAVFVAQTVIRFLTLSEIAQHRAKAIAAAKSAARAADPTAREYDKISYVLTQRKAKRLPMAGDVGRMGLAW